MSALKIEVEYKHRSGLYSETKEMWHWTVSDSTITPTTYDSEKPILAKGTNEFRWIAIRKARNVARKLGNSYSEDIILAKGDRKALDDRIAALEREVLV